MVRSTVLGLIGCLVAVLPVRSEDWAQKMFATSSHDFGQVARNAKAEHAFVLSNIYLEDVHVASVRPSCGCSSVRIENPDLKTYERGTVVATFNTTTFRGPHQATITVTFDRPFPATAQLHVQGYVRDDVLFDPESVDLGHVDRGTAAERRVAIRFTSSNGWQIRQILTSNPHLSAQVWETARDGSSVSYEMRVRLAETAPVGYLNDRLMLVTNDQRATQFPVQVQGRVTPPVMVSPATLFLGILRPGETVTKRLVVQAKRPFRVTAVTTEGNSFRLAAGAEDEAKPLHLVPVTFVANNVPGPGVQMVRVRTDVDDSVSELPAYVVVAPGDAATQ